MRNGLLLNGGWFAISSSFYCSEHFRTESEFVEFHVYLCLFDSDWQPQIIETVNLTDEAARDCFAIAACELPNSARKVNNCKDLYGVTLPHHELERHC